MKDVDRITVAEADMTPIKLPEHINECLDLICGDESRSSMDEIVPDLKYGHLLMVLQASANAFDNLISEGYPISPAKMKANMSGG